MQNSYIECALWCEQDDIDAQISKTECDSAGSLAQETVDSMRADCARFLATIPHPADLVLVRANLSQAGHDFWLTRNGHGVGFWDRPEIWTNGASERLTKHAKSFGQSNLYIGDDSLVYEG